MPYVPGIGPKDARIAFIGEAPGYVELQTGVPFTNSEGAGRELDEILRRNGLAREQVYITNVVKDSTDTPTDASIARALPALYRELATLTHCNTFVPVGAAALKALSCWKYQAITIYRGSILYTEWGAKMVPIVHPAWYMRGEWRYKPVTIADVARIVEQSAFPEIRRPKREYILAPSFDRCVAELERLYYCEQVSLDIETFSRYIACIGLSERADWAICIPFMRAGYVPYWTPMQEAVIWRLLARLMRGPSRKIGQNLYFDSTILHQHGVEVENIYFDSMLAHHLLEPELPHKLEFITSLYSEEPYYKDDGKRWNHKTADNQLWGYNCKDVVVVLDAMPQLIADLKEFGMWDYYLEHVKPLTPVLTRMKWHGLPVSQEKLAERRKELGDEIKIQQDQLNHLVGKHINVKSPNDVEYLCILKGVKITARTAKTNKPKLDEDHVLMYAAQRPCKEFDLLLAIRKLRTRLSGFTNLICDHENMYHPDLLQHGTKSGRCSGSGDDQGPQPQNIPKKMRDIFSARPGWEILEGDYKQGEAMLTAWYAVDYAMMQNFIDGKDIHRFTGGICFSKRPDQITDEERDRSKRIVHGFDYRMGVRKAIQVLRAAGIFISESEMKRMRDAYFRACPAIPSWHRMIEDELRRWRVLDTCLGRKRPFLGLIDDHTINEAVSYKPQATLAQMTNDALVKLDKCLPEPARIIMQVHDSILVYSPICDREQNLTLIQDCMLTPLTINERALTIPVDLKYGPDWRNRTEWHNAKVTNLVA